MQGISGVGRVRKKARFLVWSENSEPLHPDSYHTTNEYLTSGITSVGIGAAKNVFSEFWPDIKRRIHRWELARESGHAAFRVQRQKKNEFNAT